MEEINEARLEAMMERYRREMLRYQRATPPGGETLAESLERAEKKTQSTCHSCMTAEGAPKKKRHPLPPEEAEEEEIISDVPDTAEDGALSESVVDTGTKEANIAENADSVACGERDDRGSSLPEEEALPAALPLYRHMFFPERPRPKPVKPMPRPRPNINRPAPPRENVPQEAPPHPVDNRPAPPPGENAPQTPDSPGPRESTAENAKEVIPAAKVAAVDAADRLFSDGGGEDVLVRTLGEKLSALDDGTLTRVLSIISKGDPDLAAAVSRAIRR